MFYYYHCVIFRYKNEFFIEIDYPTVCRTKTKIILQNGLIQKDQILDITDDSNICLMSSNYILLGCDLRKPSDIFDLVTRKEILNLINVSLKNSGKNAINFILFNECSLCYIDQNLTDKLIKMLIDVFHNYYPQASITYFGYEMTKSLSCHTGFGQFLLNHFQSLGAPILTFISENAIKERLIKLNFDQISIINMKWFYREILNQDENDRNRIKFIEPFDEIEELDNVCASYSLTIGKQFHKLENSNFKFNAEGNFQAKLTNLISYKIFSIFGHCSNFDKENKVIRIFGGFGNEPNKSFEISQKPELISNSGHRRFKNILELKLNDSLDKVEKLNVINAKNQLCNINRIHCRVESLDTNHFLLSGGRTSPSRSLSNSIIKIDFHLNEFEVIQSFDDLNLATYRHICSRFGSESNLLIQFSGIGSNGTIQIFDIESAKWLIINREKLNINRHSSAFSSYGPNSLLVHGGLDYNNNFICNNNFDLIDNRDPIIKHYSIENFDQRLYSHQMKILSEYNILLIGGIGHKFIGNNVFQIDLRAMKIVEKYELTSDEILMLQNFSCELVAEKNLWFLGGGGNCFSFGTHFNSILFCNHNFNQF